MKAAAARRAAAEALGTFFLVLIGPGAVMVDAYSGGAISQVGVALAFAFVVLAMIYALGYLSWHHALRWVPLSNQSAEVAPSPGNHLCHPAS